MLFIFSSDITGVAVPVPNFFSYIPASDTDAAAVISNGIKKRLARSWSKFFINGKPIFNNGARSPPRNAPDCIVIDDWVFDSLVSNDKYLANALQRFGH